IQQRTVDSLKSGSRIRVAIPMLVGILCIFCSYKIYQIGERDTYIQKHSPLIKMPIVGRVNGLGTVKSPNKIYVSYKGTRYTLESSNRHFRKTARLDSIDVHFDELTDKAVLPNVKVTGPYSLIILIAMTGVFLIGYTIAHLR
ncbi:hypothetical protein, partial [Nibrella saemangeumensis]|uniref:hypothetical protein n=1 Tax=Nibrella saemangeumensis TaxID=1084526 RepID=UPI0031EE4135